MSAPGKSKISAPVYRTVTLLAFVLGIAALTGYLYANAGGYVPGFSKQRDYKVAFDVPTVANVVPFVDVYTAGVPVGKVDAIDRVANDKIRLTLALDDAVAPLHEGTKVQISEKSLTGQPMVRIEPGTGPNTYPSGTVLPESAVKPTVQLRDVLASLDKPTGTPSAAWSGSCPPAPTAGSRTSPGSWPGCPTWAATATRCSSRCPTSPPTWKRCPGSCPR